MAKLEFDKIDKEKLKRQMDEIIRYIQGDPNASLEHAKRYLAIAVAIVGVILSCYLMYAAVKVANAPRINLQLTAINSQNLNRMLWDVKTSHVVFLFYEASCGDCRDQFENVMKFKKKEELDRTTLFLISFDEDPRDTVKFLARQGFYNTDKYALYYAKPEDREGLLTYMKEHGAQKLGELPYTAVAEADGRILADFQGRISWIQISRSISAYQEVIPKKTVTQPRTHRLN